MSSWQSIPGGAGFVPHPLEGLVDGLLQGHQLALQMQAAKRAQQEFLTNEALRNQEMSLSDLKTRMLLGSSARPVSDAGTVTEDPSQGSIPPSPATPSPSAPGPTGSWTDLPSRLLGRPDLQPGPIYEQPQGPLPNLQGPPSQPAAPLPAPTGVPSGAQPLPAPAGATSSGQALTQPTQTPYVRKADASRTVTWGGRKYELMSPEEQARTAAQSKAAGQQILDEAALRTQLNNARISRNFQLQTQGGVPAQGFGDYGIPDGTMLTRDELKSWTEARDEHLTKLAAIRKANMLLTSPDQEVWDVSQFGQTPGQPAAPGAAPAAPSTGAPTATPAAGPGATPAAGVTPPAGAPGMRLLAGGGSKRATGEFGAYLRAALLKHGYTEQNAPPDLVMQATTDYARKAKDPADLEQLRQMRELTMQLTQQRLDDLKAKQGTTMVDYQPGTREYKIAEGLAYGKLTMQDFRTLMSRSGDVNKKMDIYNKASELNPNFNPAAFEMGYKLASSPKVQQQLSSMDNVKRAIPDLLQLSDAASRTGVPLLNQFILKGGYKLGNQNYSNLATARTAFADELSGALGFGGATDMSKQMGLDMTDPNMSPEAFRNAIQNVVAPFIDRKKQTTLDQMGIYGQPGMNPAAGPAVQPTAGGGRGAPGGIEPLPPRLSVADVGKIYISPKTGQKMKITAVNPQDPTQFKFEAVQ